MGSRLFDIIYWCARRLPNATTLLARSAPDGDVESSKAPIGNRTVSPASCSLLRSTASLKTTRAFERLQEGDASSEPFESEGSTRSPRGKDRRAFTEQDCSVATEDDTPAARASPLHIFEPPHTRGVRDDERTCAEQYDQPVRVVFHPHATFGEDGVGRCVDCRRHGAANVVDRCSKQLTPFD